MTNFDYLKYEPKFESFSDVAISAEKIVRIDYDACILNCRRAMEFAVKWMYSVDTVLDMPYQDNLVSLINTDEFRGIVDGFMETYRHDSAYGESCGAWRQKIYF